MTFEEYKKKIFKERPDVKEEYDALEKEFKEKSEIIREKLKSGNTDEELTPDVDIRIVYPE